MFKQYEDGMLGVDYARILGVSKYSVYYADMGDVKEIIIPQSLAREVEERYMRYLNGESEETLRRNQD